MAAHHEASEARCQARGAAAAPPPAERHAPDRPVVVRHIALDLAVNLEARTLRGSARHELSVIAGEAPVVMLDAVALTIESVTADSRAVPFVHDGERILIRPPKPWKRGEEHTLAIAYHGRPERGLHFIAPDEIETEKPLQAWTQGQDEDARFWFPCIDHPSQKATTELRVRVPRGFEAVSNGRLARREDVGQETEFHWVQDVPHVTYLVSLVIGRFDIVEDQAGDVALRYLVPVGDAGGARATFSRTPRMIALFERLFGHPYPYAKYDQIVVSDFVFGGMENTSATTLYDYCLLDESVEGVVDSDDLIAHELAHQWFGDLLTCSDWSHAWLNEGFATYSEVLWHEHGESPERAAYHLFEEARVYFDEARSEYRRPIVTNRYEAPVEIFDRHLYQKAAGVLHHLRLELGDDAFFRGVRRYVTTHARGLVDTHDLRRALEAESGRNLEPYFDQWIFRPGHPEIEVTHTYEEATRRLTLTVRQTQEGARERPFRFKLRTRAYLAGGAPPYVERTFEVTSDEHAFGWTLHDDPCGLRVAQDGAPLVRVRFKRPDGWLTHQLQRDEGLIGRIEAALDLGRSASDAAVVALNAALLAEPTWMGQVEIARALGEARGASARDGLVAGLELRDPRARSAVARALGRFRDDAVAAAALEALLEREKAPLVRAAACHALGTIRAPSAHALLTKHLWDPSWNEVIGRACLDGLGALRDRTLAPLFMNGAARGQHELRRTASVAALVETMEAAESKTEVRELLERLLEDPSYRIATAAIHGLRRLRDAAAVAALDRLASRRFVDARIRQTARSAIKSLLDDRARLGAAEIIDRVERAEDAGRKLRDRVGALERRVDAEDGRDARPSPARVRKPGPAKAVRNTRRAGRIRGKMKRRRGS